MQFCENLFYRMRYLLGLVSSSSSSSTEQVDDMLLDSFSRVESTEIRDILYERIPSRLAVKRERLEPVTAVTYSVSTPDNSYNTLGCELSFSTSFVYISNNEQSPSPFATHNGIEFLFLCSTFGCK